MKLCRLSDSWLEEICLNSAYGNYMLQAGELDNGNTPQMPGHLWCTDIFTTMNPFTDAGLML